jgi:hypothetical protein
VTSSTGIARGLPGLGECAVGVDPPPDVDVRPFVPAAQHPRIGQQVHVLSAQPERFTNPHACLRKELDEEFVAVAPGQAEQHVDLLIRQPLIARDCDPVLDRSGLGRAALAVLTWVEPRRQVAQELRLSERVDHRRRHPALQAAPRQEFPDGPMIAFAVPSLRYRTTAPGLRDRDGIGSSTSQVFSVLNARPAPHSPARYAHASTCNSRSSSTTTHDTDSSAATARSAR